MIQFEPFQPADFRRLISWVNNEELLVQFGGPLFSYPLTEAQLYTYLEDKNRHAFKVVDVNSKQTIGHAEIYQHEEYKVKLCWILIGDENHRGKGTGKEIINQLVSYSINQLKITAIELNVYDWNTAAIKCYEKAGFAIVPEKYTTIDVKGETWKALNMTYRTQ